jgi:predicted dehydrogenase
MLIDFGKASYLDKARQQPEKVKMVLEKIRTDGLASTVEAVRAKLDQPIPLGYSNVGVVSQIGPDAEGFSVGDRVVSNGSHADMVRVPKYLCAVIPETVDNETAAFTVLGSIALQGMRLVSPTLGESVVVSGAGLIGLLAVQLLRAQGCRVLAIDFDAEKLALAAQFGAETCDLSNNEDPVTAGMAFSRGMGVDAVIIAASTKSNDPVKQAARMSRKRGRIVLVGVTGLELDRADFYKKELTFQVSCSYGPGRYDSNYEEKGQDYPIGYVRWTEQRNFIAVLDLMAAGKLDVKPLISHRFAFEDAALAYDELSTNKSVLGILLEYEAGSAGQSSSTVQLSTSKSSNASKIVVGCIGAGNYASRVLIPAFQQSGARLHTIVTSGGVNGVIQGEKAGFEQASSESSQLFDNNEINAAVIATRHDSHAELVIGALKSGKHVFVEKPLCLSLQELEEIDSAYSESDQLLMVGFNRRFAPHIKTINSLLDASSEPKAFVMTVNAGAIPSEHWAQDKAVGGGRIIGEACHFVDLLRYLSGSSISKSSISRMASENGDSASISLQFANGSTGTVHYLANGNKSFPKERLEVFAGGGILQLDNFRKLKGFGWPGFRKQNLFKQDKGQVVCVKAFVDAVESGGESPIPFDEIVEVSRVCIGLANQ